MKHGRVRDSPERKICKRFYRIDPQKDGIVDIYLVPEATEYGDATDAKEYDITLLIVRGVVPWNGMEEDIRSRYDSWCESAEKIEI